MLGDILLRRGLITEYQLAKALALQERQGSRLGDILIGEGMIGYHTLYQALAEHHALPFIDLIREPPQAELLQERRIGHYLRYRALPWKREDAVVIAVCEMSDEMENWAREHYGETVRFAVTSPFDIRKTIEQHFGLRLESDSRLALWQRDPQASARVTLPPLQKAIAGKLSLFASIVTVHAPLGLALLTLMLCHLAYGITMLFKCLVFACAGRRHIDQDWQARLATLDDRSLPVYTILLPMFDEVKTLPRLLRAMQQFDYPASKLDIKIVLEADDAATLAATRALHPRYQFEIIIVPPSALRTKPRACNYALRFARGDYVTIYDAEDRPDPLQLKKAIYQFRHAPPQVICLQARLNYYNAYDNLLTRFFSLEYSMLFNFTLHGLERLEIPIPLGGTSNHILLKRLRELGEWDPYNVTEDADLGTRLAAKGYRTQMLDSLTKEEAPLAVTAWLGQRTRWIKGYMQTWLVHMRDPVKLYRTLGAKGFWGFQLFIGFSSFTFLTAPLVWLLPLIWMFEGAQVQLVYPPWLLQLALANLMLNLTMHWAFALRCLPFYRGHTARMLGATLLYPLYLFLHSIASYRAVWQLAVNPHFWAKTAHGLAKEPAVAAPEMLDMADAIPLTSG